MKEFNFESVSKPQLALTALLVVFYSIFFLFLFAELGFTFEVLHLSDTVSTINNVLFFLPLCFSVVFISSMMMMLACSYFQLKALNTTVKKIYKSHDNATVRQIIKTISIMYDTLCDAFEEFSSFYFPNNAVFISGFLYYNILFYFVVFIYIKNPNERNFLFGLISFLWVAFYAPCIIWLITFASWIEKDGVKTANLIQKLANVDRDPTYLKLSKILMQQVTHRRSKITCFMFDLNWKFFFSMLGGISSFTIIFIQFYDVAN